MGFSKSKQLINIIITIINARILRKTFKLKEKRSNYEDKINDHIINVRIQLTNVIKTTLENSDVYNFF